MRVSLIGGGELPGGGGRVTRAEPRRSAHFTDRPSTFQHHAEGCRNPAGGTAMVTGGLL
jgi:hypothetical protein